MSTFKLSSRALPLSAALIGLLACSSEPTAPPANTGAAATTEGVATTGDLGTSLLSSSSSSTGSGSTSTNGVATSGAGTSGTTGAGGGISNTTTTLGSTTTGTGSGGAGTTGELGTTSASAGGIGGSATANVTTTGGSSTPPTASAGCGTSSGRPETLNVNGEYIVTFPPSYDGAAPIPLIFGFHGAGRTNQQFRETDARTQNTDLEANYIMAYPKSSGNDWTGQLSANLTRFDTLYEMLLESYCVDTSRVFATGHSSGAGFTTELVCQRGDRFRGVAPVAAWEIGQNCPATPTMIIHGANDSERGNNGSAYVERYRTWNGCSSSSMPYEVEGCMGGNNAQVNPGCIEYQDCSAAPTIWCSHNDPNYSDTNHGWPCFANYAIFDFFASLG